MTIAAATLSEPVQRFDLDSTPKIELMPSGQYRIAARATRTGVLEYRLPDGTVRRELRLPEEVFSEDSMRSLRGVALTDLHPTEPVTPVNWQLLARGHVADDVRPDGQYLACTVVASHADMIGKIDRGEAHDLSCGYTTQLEHTSGIWEGQSYDAIQRNIIYNHVGAGPRAWGRAGQDVSLRVDGAYCTLPEMALHRIDGTDYEVGSKAHLDALDRFTTTQAKALADATKAAADATTRADAADKLVKDTIASVPKLVEERTWLISIGRSKDPKFCTDKKDQGISQEDLLAKVIKLVLPKFNPAGKSPEAILAVLEAYAFPDAEEEPKDEPKDPAGPPAPGAQPPALDSISAVRNAGPAPKQDATDAPLTLDEIIRQDRQRRADQAAIKINK